MMLDDERWRQHLREQLLQRGKDDAQIQRRWEKHMRQHRFWPVSGVVNQPNTQKLRKTKKNEKAK